MSPKQHGGKRPGAGRKSCRTDKLAALFVADLLAVSLTYGRTLLRTGECSLTPAQQRTMALCIESGMTDDEILVRLKGAA
jgi:hypothetical protein